MHVICTATRMRNSQFSDKVLSKIKGHMLVPGLSMGRLSCDAVRREGGREGEREEADKETIRC